MLVFKLALRNIFRNRRRSLLTGLSMFGGYIMLVVAFSVQEGTYGSILELYTQDHSGHIQLTESTYQDKPTLYKTVNNYKTLIADIEALDFVKSVTPRIQSAALAYGQKKTAPAFLVGIDAVREQQTSFLAEKIRQGEFLASGPDVDGYYQAMIGKGLSNQLGLNVGNELVLISQGADGSLANDIFIISAIIGDKDSAERLNVYLPLEGIQQFLVMPGKVHQIIILISDYKASTDRAEDIRTNLSPILQKFNLDVFPWQIVEREFYRLMRADIEGNIVTQYIVIFLVCIGVLNTILMNILERTGEFGVLKAIGTTPQRIFNQILIEAVTLAVMSCIAGLIVALPLNWYLVNVGLLLPEPTDISGLILESIKGYMSLWVFLRPVLIIVIATGVIAVFPAYRAARIVPLDAMRSL